MDNDEAYRLVDFFWGTELGYLRYDFDVKNQRGLIHPLNHLDVNITEQAHYKIGLANRISPIEFEDILYENSDCYFAVKNEMVKINRLNRFRETQRKRNRYHKKIGRKRLR